MSWKSVSSFLLGGMLCFVAGVAWAQTDPLPSWNDGQVKNSINDFVARVTAEGGSDFVPAPERVAVFDNDGTLWTEQPFYSRASSLSTASRRWPRSIRNGRRRNPSRRCSTAT